MNTWKPKILQRLSMAHPYIDGLGAYLADMAGSSQATASATLARFMQMRSEGSALSISDLGQKFLDQLQAVLEEEVAAARDPEKIRAGLIELGVSPERVTDQALRVARVLADEEGLDLDQIVDHLTKMSAVVMAAIDPEGEPMPIPKGAGDGAAFLRMLADHGPKQPPTVEELYNAFRDLARAEGVLSELPDLADLPEPFADVWALLARWVETLMQNAANAARAEPAPPPAASQPSAKWRADLIAIGRSCNLGVTLYRLLMSASDFSTTPQGILDAVVEFEAKCPDDLREAHKEWSDPAKEILCAAIAAERPAQSPIDSIVIPPLGTVSIGNGATITLDAPIVLRNIDGLPASLADQRGPFTITGWQVRQAFVECHYALPTSQKSDWTADMIQAVTSVDLLPVWNALARRFGERIFYAEVGRHTTVRLWMDASEKLSAALKEGARLTDERDALQMKLAALEHQANVDHAKGRLSDAELLAKKEKTIERQDEMLDAWQAFASDMLQNKVGTLAEVKRRLTQLHHTNAAKRGKSAGDNGDAVPFSAQVFGEDRAAWPGSIEVTTGVPRSALSTRDWLCWLAGGDILVRAAVRLEHAPGRVESGGRTVEVKPPLWAELLRDVFTAAGAPTRDEDAQSLDRIRRAGRTGPRGVKA